MRDSDAGRGAGGRGAETGGAAIEGADEGGQHLRPALRREGCFVDERDDGGDGIDVRRRPVEGGTGTIKTGCGSSGTACGRRPILGHDPLLDVRQGPGPGWREAMSRPRENTVFEMKWIDCAVCHTAS
jgi:hypothetical protein